MSNTDGRKTTPPFYSDVPSTYRQVSTEEQPLLSVEKTYKLAREERKRGWVRAEGGHLQNGLLLLINSLPPELRRRAYASVQALARSYIDSSPATRAGQSSLLSRTLEDVENLRHLQGRLASGDEKKG